MAIGYLPAAEMPYRGRVSTREEQFAMIDGVTAEAVHAAATRFLKPEEIRSAVVGPPGLDISGALAGAPATA